MPDKPNLCDVNTIDKFITASCSRFLSYPPLRMMIAECFAGYPGHTLCNYFGAVVRVAGGFLAVLAFRHDVRHMRCRYNPALGCKPLVSALLDVDYFATRVIHYLPLSFSRVSTAAANFEAGSSATLLIL